MNDNATGRTDGSKGPSSNQESNKQVSNKTRQEILTELIALINSLFDPVNLINNQYLTYKALGTSFEIPIKIIHDERNILQKTEDTELIDEALAKAENVVLKKNGDNIETVRPKKDQTKTNIKIKGFERKEADDLKKHVYEFVKQPDDIAVWNVNADIQLATVVCRDEQITQDLYEGLSKTKFNGKTLECTVGYESLYIAALDIAQKKSKYIPNPYSYNYTGVPMGGNPYYGNQFMMGMYNPNMGRPGYYPGGGRGGRPWNGGKKGGKNYNNGRRSYKKGDNTRVEVNDNDFPPLDKKEDDEGGVPQ